MLEPLIVQTKKFLQDDMGLEVKETFISQLEQNKLLLKDETSMIGVGGKLNQLVVMSYDNSLLAKLVDAFMDGEEIPADEAQELQNSVCGEVINTIVGLSLSSFPNTGEMINITPPITFNTASDLIKHKNSKIISVNVITNYGEMSVGIISSKDIREYGTSL